MEILPGKPDSPVSPFLSLVLNANVSTLAHLDGKDFVLCLVLAIGEFLGGGLVLGEQGLVVEARNSDFLAFCSESTTHFNLKYMGSGLPWCCTQIRSFLSGGTSEMGGQDIILCVESLNDCVLSNFCA